MIKPNHTFKGMVVGVYDGDTLDVHIEPFPAHKGFRIFAEKRCRLARINAPEMKDPNPAIVKAAIAARDWIRAKVLNKEVTVALGSPDTYERYITELYYMDGKTQINLNDELLSKGLVAVYVGKDGKP